MRSAGSKQQKPSKHSSKPNLNLRQEQFMEACDLGSRYNVLKSATRRHGAASSPDRDANGPGQQNGRDDESHSPRSSVRRAANKDCDAVSHWAMATISGAVLGAKNRIYTSRVGTCCSEKKKLSADHS